MSDQNKDLAQREMKYQTDYGEVKLTPALVKRYLVSGGGAVSDTEIIMFMQLCKYQGLNPWVREAFLIKYTGNSPATLVVAKQAYDKRADKSDDYDGKVSGVCVLVEGQLQQRKGSLVLPGETLVGAWARVYRKSKKVPFEVSVNFSEYVGKTKEGETTRQWSRMPATMIVKVAEGQALRAAFPREYQGLYEESEITAAAETTQVQAEIVTTTPTTVQDQLPADPTIALRAEIQTLIDALPDEQKTAFTKALKNMKSEAILRTFKAQIEAMGGAGPSEPAEQPSGGDGDQGAGNGDLDLY